MWKRKARRRILYNNSLLHTIKLLIWNSLSISRWFPLMHLVIPVGYPLK
jgi:hypothetical protein